MNLSNSGRVPFFARPHNRPRESSLGRNPRQAGFRRGMPNTSCNDFNPCTVDHCIAGDCVNVPMPDLDGDGICDRMDN